MRIFKKILILLLIIFIALQFYRSPKNESGDDAKHISTFAPIPPPVNEILVKACYDCHSNKTRYPWYSHIQPVGIWLHNHVVDGKREINFSEFAAYNKAKQYHKLEECIDEVKHDQMPLDSYKITHTDARLTDAEKQTLVAWFDDVRQKMQQTYPADSLVRRR